MPQATPSNEGPTPHPPRLQMRGVSKRFGATVALDGVDFAVAPGEVHALVGENGAGKSTLMKVLSGAVAADAGSMQLDGRPFRPRNPLEARRGGVAMIYQELSLVPHLSVMENITLGLEPTRLGLIAWKRIRRQAIEALAELEHAEIPPEVPVGRLSLGAQQLVEIGRAVAIGCRLLVLDEPTSSLAGPDVRRLFRLIRRLKGRGHAVVYISHFLEEVRQISDRYTVLRDGRSVSSGRTAETTTDRIVAMMVGRQVADLYPRSSRTPGDVVLRVKGLAGMEKPHSASLALRRGQVLGIAGLVGAGRTELLRTIFGLDPVRRGEITVGTFVGPTSPARRWAQGVGILSENRKDEGLAASLSVADNATLSRLTGLGPLGLISPRRQDAATVRWLRKLDVRCRGPRQKVVDLSGGNQQKVALARLLHHDVDVLLLDEPTRGIDVGSKALIYRAIDELAAGHGASGDGASGRKPRAILIVSSYLPELLGVCDAVAVMCRGRLGPTRPVGSVDEHQLMLEATGAEATGYGETGYGETGAEETR